MATISSIMIDLPLPDNLVLDGLEIKKACDYIRGHIGPQSCDAFDLPISISCKSGDINYNYRRPGDISYLPKRLTSQREDEVGVDFVTQTRILRLLFRLENGLIVLSGVEYHPHNPIPLS
jgi:hypothetical protein